MSAGSAAHRVSFVLLVLSACGADAGEGPGKATQLPQLLEVPAGSVTSGFAAGRLRQKVELSAFRITKYPVTRVQYERCVNAGACAAVDTPACELGDGGVLAGFSVEGQRSPALCVGHEAARQYCSWIGGRLPTLAEWFEAARGPSPQPYSWGTEEPSCARHARAQRLVPAGPEDEGALARFAPCAVVDDGGKLVVSKRAAGASPYGVEDVLLAPAELIATDSEAQFSACNAGFQACLVTGSKPAAIESLVPISAQTTAASVPPYGFRCVLGED